MIAEGLRDEELHAYVDGELDAKRVGEIDGIAAREPAVAEALEMIRRQNAQLHHAFDPVLDEYVPSRLAAAGAPPRRGLWRAAAAAGWVAAGVAVGWSARDRTPEPQHVVLPRQAAVAHVAFAPEVRHPVEVTAAEEAHLVAWLSKRLGTRLKAPRLDALGFELLGGRLLPESGRPGAQFMYQDTAGKRLTLYVSTDAGNRDSAFRYTVENGVHVFYWIDQHLGYALSGDLEKAQMLRVARVVYEQLQP